MYYLMISMQPTQRAQSAPPPHTKPCMHVCCKPWIAMLLEACEMLLETCYMLLNSDMNSAGSMLEWRSDFSLFWGVQAQNSFCMSEVMVCKLCNKNVWHFTFDPDESNKPIPKCHFENGKFKVVPYSENCLVFMFNGGSSSSLTICPIDKKIGMGNSYY